MDEDGKQMISAVNRKLNGFKYIDTECSYDFLFIYDGDSYNSPMLASLSGSNNPETILARSGKMLMYLFSDRNYERKGFKVHYEIKDCPFNCSNQGNCVDFRCYCYPGRTGEFCEREQCPLDCSHGQCVPDEENDNMTSSCKCDPGYIGYMCNISINDAEGSEYWYDVLPQGMGLKSRSAHAETWEMHANDSTVQPLELSGHTLTRVEDDLYVFGGKTVDGQFWAKMYKIDGYIPSQWEEVLPLAGKSSARRLVGHSAVYHNESKSLLIYGGYSHSPDQPRYGSHTNDLHIFHIKNLIWSKINFDIDKISQNVPSQRSFHSVQIMGNYMVVYGGNAHIHHEVETCYDYKIYLYHLGCHVWVDASTLMGKYMEVIESTTNRGRVSHVSAVANGNLLLVAGGYAGYVKGDLRLFKFPQIIAPPSYEAGLDLDYCMNITWRDKCQTNPACFFCNDPKSCMHRTLEHKCKEMTSYMAMPRALCPGICPRLTTCISCLSQGQGASLTEKSLERRTYIQPCNWCVKEAKCQQRSKPQGNCISPTNTVSGTVGWWNGLSASLSQIDQCRVEDLPAGLIATKYRSGFGENNMPDEVEIIRQTTESETFRHIYVRQGYKSQIRWSGFIHPLNASVTGLISSPQMQYALQLMVEKISVKIWLSRNETKLAEKVFDLDIKDKNGRIEDEQMTRADRSLLFPNISRGLKYYIELSGLHDYPNYSESMHLGVKMYNLTLKWDGKANNGNQMPKYHPFSYEFLEPYSQGDCKKFTNCLSCMTDTKCGWCDPMDSCMQRNNSDNTCVGEGSVLMITEPSVCPVCSDHVERQNCSSCLDISECAWCENLRTCLPFYDYVSRHRHGQCTEWIDSETKSASNPFMCRNCSEHKKCDKCMLTFNCGWCGNVANPTIGVCIEGDFAGPYGNVTCSAIVNTNHGNIVKMSDHSDWSYSRCPDVNECTLGLSHCHANATCTDTPDEYICTCNRGFYGDGKSCTKTCYHKCAMGECLEDQGEYYCDCNIGWTGEDCAVDCKCNGHSGCEFGVGKCDFCLNGTTGPYCNECLEGYYGDPKTVDGACYCTGHTQDYHCNKCMDNYYGNPGNGGKCYLQCDHGMIVNNLTAGSMGSHSGPGVSGWRAYCLWILMTEPRAHPQSITFTLEQLAVECELDHVYVYDGIPEFIDSAGLGVLLGAFCGFHSLDINVTANSGILTEESSCEKVITEGSATYQITAFPPPPSTLPQGPNTLSYDPVSHTYDPWGQRGPVPRYGHVLIHCDNDIMYVFGGRSLKYGLLNDIWQYSFVTHNWTEVKPISNIQPNSRYFHTGVCIPRRKTFYIFGGLVGQHDTSKEMWKFAIDARKWSGPMEPVWVSEVAGHSMTLTSEDKLVIIGGFSTKDYFSDSVYVFDFNSYPTNWERHNTDNITQAKPTGIYGHSAVYEPQSQTIYIYGGYVYREERWRVSRSLFTYDVATNSWNLLQPEVQDLPEMEQFLKETRYFHIGAGLAGHMVILGGFSHQHEPSDVALVYNYRCNYWHRLHLDGEDVTWPSIWLLAVTLTGTTHADVGTLETALKTMSTFLPSKEWTCVLSKRMYLGYHGNRTEVLGQKDECPKPCYEYESCGECLSSIGGEGGASECFWSEGLNECMPPAYLSLHCLGGVCGTILQGPRDKCPLPCSTYTKCADCRQAQGCGWCADGSENGRGVCLQGTLSGPFNQQMCKKKNNAYPEKKTDTDVFERDPQWAYATCPPENECLNGHDNCDTDTEDCSDRLGSQCQECKPLYVGDPRDGGRCTSCHDFCHGHFDVCLYYLDTARFGQEIDRLLKKYGSAKSQAFYEEFKRYQHAGPTTRNSTKCLSCRDNTKGERCEKCEPGYFRRPNMKPDEPCIKCMCNGHGDSCDADSGLNCVCKNNTETRCSIEQGNSDPKCHEKQCADCKEYFLGKPKSGHQCYRTMTVSRDYCLDPNTQAECNRIPTALDHGGTVFFVVQPKYVNVDIRVTIDITFGGIDVFFSPREDTFVVHTDRYTGKHVVDLDPGYKTYTRRKRSEIVVTEQSYVREVEAKTLNTFITVHSPETILVIRNLRGRLVITLPNEKLNLKTSRFYMVFLSTGSSVRNETLGNIYFRQDQPHIDLFVFFSVFFSCFFLFLAMCVLVWKFKQGCDARRNRQQRAQEMLHMASRPFAKVLIHIDHPVTPFNISPSLRPRPPRKPTERTPFLASEPNIPLSQTVNTSRDKFNIVPIATEPTEDGISAVGTIVFQLPGGNSAPSHLCLGSALITQVSHMGKNRRLPVSSNC
ncbi:MEGF8-like protein [Mya arenaria]|uniref:MEGF8-like protein n=1 Tax=Mya arenaria TaxID=6604 RepID=A0ABY7GD33_MYAAR|nr:MEGF8-like protein [Mya arenaria]